MKFKNRIKELNLLETLYEEKRAKLIILYGRRRVSKSELLRKFVKKHGGLYLLFRQQSINDQLEFLSLQLSEFFNDDFLKINPFSSLDSFFLYLSKKKLPIIFDEFPYLVESSKSTLSIFQGYWDNYFSKNNSFIILCGSSISMMEELLGKKSPIYGRRTEQILLEILNFKHSCLFFKDSLSFREKIVYYSILGGMPAYLLEFDFSKSLEHNLLNNLLKKNKFLYQDVLFSLKEELNDPKNYFSILASVAKGNTKLNDIVNDTGFERSFVNKYLSVLISLQLVERVIPITEKNYSKSRKGLYKIKDNFFNFWFRYVFGNEIYVEQEKQVKLIKDLILPTLDSYCGRVFEEVVLEDLISKKEFDNYLIGRHWDKNSETDIVGVDKKNKKILIGEVKFKELSEKEIKKIFFDLKEKSGVINEKKYSEEFLVAFLGKKGIKYVRRENL